MSTTEVTEILALGEDRDDPRAAMVAAIRALADFIEERPQLPLPDYVMAARWAHGRDEGVGRDELLVHGGEIKIEGDKVASHRDFGNVVTYRFDAKAANVCVEREVTKSEFVLPEELAPNGGDAA